MVKEDNTIKIRNANKKWITSTIIRLFGIGFAMMFGFLSTILNEDTWINSLVLISILISIFVLGFIIPDKIMFGKNLVKKRYEDI